MTNSIPRELPVKIPTVAFKGPHDTDAAIFRLAASNLDNGYDAGGGCVKACISQLLRNAADALDSAGVVDPEYSYYEYQRQRMRAAGGDGDA